MLELFKHTANYFKVVFVACFLLDALAEGGAIEAGKWREEVCFSGGETLFYFIVFSGRLCLEVVNGS